MISLNYKLKRLQSLVIESAEKMNRAMDDDAKKEYHRDMLVLESLIEDVRDAMVHFDVAKWSRLDIECTMENINIKIEDDTKREEFVEDVIAFMESNFDAGYGVNWGVIEDAVYSIADRENGVL